MTRARCLLGIVLVLAVAAGVLPSPAPSHSQGVEVFLNVTQGGSKKLGIAIAEFTRQNAAPDPGNFTRAMPEIIGNDLRFSALFAVANIPALPDTPDGIRQEFGRLQQSGAHAAMHGLMRIDGQRLTVEFRLYDLTNPEFRLIASKVFWVEPLADHRRLAHRIADEVVYQFTGERGIAETKIAYVAQNGSTKEILMMDYDGFNRTQLTQLRSTSLSPAWSPTDWSVAFTSYFRGYPYVFRLYPFNPRRRTQEPELMSAWPGINTAPAWSPDGRTLALTLSKGGSPDIYTLRVGTSEFRQLTNNRGIDTDPSWSPTGREIVFTSDRSGTPQIWVMDAEGSNPRRLTSGGTFDTQPRWSPRGDTVVFTRRAARGFDLWSIAPDGSNARPLTQGNGNNESAAWAPNGRHLVFSSTREGGRAQLYTMLADGSEQQPLTRDRGEASSPTWSPRPQ
jgi:TolB protein